MRADISPSPVAAPRWRDRLAELTPGDRVVVRLRSGPDLAQILLGCFEADLVAVPLHPDSTDAEVARFVGRVRASLIVDGGAGSLTTISVPGEPDPAAAGLAFIMFTSGSTGAPKGVMLSRAAVTGNAAKTAGLHRFGPGRPHATCLPLYHCNALVMSLVGARLTGTPLILRGRFDPEDYFAAIAAGGARTASIVPSLLPALLRARPAWPDGLDYLITAAAPLTSEVAGEFHRRYGPRLRQGYGLTEAVNFSFVMPPMDSADYVDQYVRRFPPVGLPLPATEFSLEDGEVWVRTPDRLDGYWHDDPATAKVLSSDGWLRTGDLGELRDGFLVLRGRRAEVVNRGGEKYYPLDIEFRWRDRGLAGTFAAVPVPEPDLGHEIGLVLADEPVESARPLYDRRALQPAAVQAGGFLTTSTGKPRRGLMGGRFAVRREDAYRYDELLDHAARAAALGRVLAAAGTPLHSVAVALASARVRPGGRRGYPATAWHEALSLVASGSAAGEAGGGLAGRLAGDWPATSYRELARAQLRAWDLDPGDCLLLGDGCAAGDGAAGDGAAGGGAAGDGAAGGCAAESYPAVVVFDVLNPVPTTGYQRLASRLRPGGYLLVADAPEVTTPDGTPWAGSLVRTWLGPVAWGLRPGRWDRLAALRDAGLGELGFSILRAGRHDVGGLVWGRAPWSGRDRPVDRDGGRIYASSARKGGAAHAADQ